MANPTIGKPFSSERRTEIVLGYLDNESKPYIEIANIVGLTKEQFTAVRKTNWFWPAVNKEKQRRCQTDLFSHAKKIDSEDYDLYLVPKGK